MKEDQPHPISNVDIVVYTLATLAGAEKTIHSEDIAAKCFELSPSRFSWRLPQYRGRWPDKYIVKTALEDAKKKLYGALVQGTYALDLSKDGWRITPEGVEWLAKNKVRVARALKQKPLILPKRDAERFTKKLRADVCFKHFQQKGSLEGLSSYMFTDMLACSPDASKDIIKRKFDRLLATAKLVNDKEVIAFLDACTSAFSSILTAN
jgi:hypothetical protein